jgi:flagellar secretion chaperone FliS
MAGNTNTQYLESRILTASQPRIHLMLLEGAARQCTFAQQAGANEFWGEFDAALGKAMDIVEELVRSVSGKQHSISDSLEEQYAFVFRELAVSRVNMDMDKLEACGKLLEVHRETWKQVCENSDAGQAKRPAVIAPHLATDAPLPSERFSFEA